MPFLFFNCFLQKILYVDKKNEINYLVILILILEDLFNYFNKRMASIYYHHFLKINLRIYEFYSILENNLIKNNKNYQITNEFCILGIYI